MIKGGTALDDESLLYKFKRMEGGYSTLAEFDNNIILLYFFTSYCIPCLADFSFFRKNKDLLSENGIIIIGVGMDYNKEITLKPFVNYNRFNFPVMVADDNIFKGDWAFGKITTTPTTILINKKEKRYYIHTGNIRKDIILQIK